MYNEYIQFDAFTPRRSNRRVNRNIVVFQCLSCDIKTKNQVQIFDLLLIMIYTVTCVCVCVCIIHSVYDCQCMWMECTSCSILAWTSRFVVGRHCGVSNGCGGSSGGGCEWREKKYGRRVCIGDGYQIYSSQLRCAYAHDVYVPIRSVSIITALHVLA